MSHHRLRGRADTAAPAPPSAAITWRAIAPVYAGLLVAMLLASLDQTVFGTALPTIVGDLGGLDHMLWVTTAYILTSTITMPVYGKLGDLVGRKFLFIAALVLFGIGSIVGGLASDLSTLITGRAVQGLGGGGLMILAQAIIADIVPPRERGKYMGVLGGVFALSAVLGPIIGGWLTDGVGWRWVFWLNVPLAIAAIAAAAVFLRMPERDTERPKLDVAGIATMAVAVTGIVLITSWGGTEYEWDSPVILSLIAVVLAAGAAFVLVERKAAEPIIPLFLFRDLNFNLATAGGLVIAVAMFGVIAYLPSYLQMVSRLSATASGLLMLPMVGGLMLTAVTTGAISSKTGRYRWMPIASTLVVAAGLLLLSSVTVDASLWTISACLFVFGAGIGLGMQILVLIVQNSFPVTQVGTATAASNFFREIGAAIGSAIVGTLFTDRLVGLLSSRLPVAPGGVGPAAPDRNSLTPAIVDSLPDAIRDIIVGSYNEALMPALQYLIPLMLIGTVLLLFVDEKPLAATNDVPADGDLPDGVPADTQGSAPADTTGEVPGSAVEVATKATSGGDSTGHALRAPSKLHAFNRYEIKYLIDAGQVPALRRALTRRMNLDSHSGEGGYGIWSVYYDTPQLRFYWEKIEGLRFRRKLRVRHYGDRFGIDDDTIVYVEIKQRVNRVTQKRRIGLPYRLARQLCDQRQTVEHSPDQRAFVEEVLGLVSGLDLRPSAMTGYQRDAFVGRDADLGLRVTVDHRVRGRDRDFHLGADAENRFIIPPSRSIVEVKANERVPAWLTDLAAEANLSVVRVSKYCQSIEAFGHAPRSVFHIPDHLSENDPYQPDELGDDLPDPLRPGHRPTLTRIEA